DGIMFENDAAKSVYRELSITNNESRITHHASRITHHASRITHHASRITHHVSRITHHVSLHIPYQAVKQQIIIQESYMLVFPFEYPFGVSGLGLGHCYGYVLKCTGMDTIYAVNFINGEDPLPHVAVYHHHAFMGFRSFFFT
ncbi:hypothetical protein QUF80_20220, partial [Desulfococcaceae bacterium HSG8]|nr:hypothetical protein [Desulfococcaceae bacterium HSG8]